MSGHDLFSRDFDLLEAGAGMTTRGRTITEADLTAFSALTGDWHRQHSDATWAEQSAFGERIAHGMLLLSYALGLLPIDDERVVALRALRHVVFKRPAPIGTTIHVSTELLEKRPLDAAHGLVSIRLDVRDAGDRLLARATIDALWRRGDTAELPTPAENGDARENHGAGPAASEPEDSPLVNGRLCI